VAYAIDVHQTIGAQDAAIYEEPRQLRCREAFPSVYLDMLGKLATDAETVQEGGPQWIPAELCGGSIGESHLHLPTIDGFEAPVGHRAVVALFPDGFCLNLRVACVF